MNDKQLRREAMLKCLPLNKLLKRATNKEDVERQARDMEKNARDDVNRVYEQRKPKKKPARFHAKPPHTPEAKPPHSGHAGTQCKYCGYSHGGQRSMCPAAGQQQKGNFARVCLAKNTAGNDNIRHHAHQLGQFASTENTSDSDYVFSLPKSETAQPTVKVTINGVKGRMDADSCSSANIMGIDQYNDIAKASAVPMQLQPADNMLYAYAQTSPIRVLSGTVDSKLQTTTKPRNRSTTWGYTHN